MHFQDFRRTCARDDELSTYPSTFTPSSQQCRVSGNSNASGAHHGDSPLLQYAMADHKAQPSLGSANSIGPVDILQDLKGFIASSEEWSFKVLSAPAPCKFMLTSSIGVCRYGTQVLCHIEGNIEAP